MIRYDTIRELNVDLKAECDQLNIARVAKNKKSVKRKSKTKCQCSVGPSPRSRSSNGTTKTMEERNIVKRIF